MPATFLIGDAERQHQQQLGLETFIALLGDAADAPGFLRHQPTFRLLPTDLEDGSPPQPGRPWRGCGTAPSVVCGRELDALVTAPVNKEAIVRARYTPLSARRNSSQLANANRTAMMLLGHDERERWLRVALKVTTHVPSNRWRPTLRPPDHARHRTRGAILSRSRIAPRPHRGLRTESPRRRRRTDGRRGDHHSTGGMPGERFSTLLDR